MLRAEKDTRKFAAISVVAAGYGGDMPEDLCNELLDDIDYNYNKLKCRKIEQILPLLNLIAEEEMKGREDARSRMESVKSADGFTP